MIIWRAAIFTLVLSENISRFKTFSYSPAFLHTFDTCSLKVTFMPTLMPNNLAESHPFVHSCMTYSF